MRTLVSLFMGVGLVLGLAGQAPAQTCGDGVVDGQFTDISSSHNHTCGVTSSGGVECWGYDRPGRPITGQYMQWDPAAATNFTNVETTHNSTCGLKTDGTIQCWGTPNSAQLNAPSGTFTDLFGGSKYHYCAINSSGGLECWGVYNDTLGSNDPGSCSDAQYPGKPSCEDAGGIWTPWTSGVTKVAMAFFGGCAIKTDGTIECWGDWDGVDGSGTPPAGTFTDIAADIYHYCAVNSSGGVECWGNNDNGQLDAPSGSNFTQLTAGTYHTCGLKTDGTVECWGLGTLANPTAGFPGADCNPLQHPKSFECGQAALPAGTYTQITSGSIYHSCGIKTDGTAVCSGQNGTWGAGSPSWILDDWGYVDGVPAGEQCDDGNTSDGDSCSSSCQSTAPAVPLMTTPWMPLAFAALLLIAGLKAIGSRRQV